MRIQDLSLPRLENDWPLVFPTGTVLGESEEPKVARGHQAASTHARFRVMSDPHIHYRCDRDCAFTSNPNLAQIEGDLQENAAAGSARDATVTEIDPQEVAVRSPVRRPPVGRALGPWLRDLAGLPPGRRSSAHPQPLCDLRNRRPLPKEVDGLSHGRIRIWSHEPMFARESDGGLATRRYDPSPWGSEIMAIRGVSKTLNPGSNPGSPAATGALEACQHAPIIDHPPRAWCSW